jgi:flagellar motor switch protein FliM
MAQRAAQAAAAQRAVRPYDFRRPDRLSKEQLGVLEGLFNAFGRFLAQPLGVLLRASCRVRVARVDQHVYEELAAQLPAVGCVAVFRSPQLGGRLVVLMSFEDASFLTDLMLGGEGAQEPPGRVLGETDRLVLERFFALWPDHLRTAWRAVSDIEVSLGAVEGSLEFVQVASPQETVVMITVVVEGLLRPVEADVLLLHTGLQPVLSRLRPGAWAASPSVAAVRRWSSRGSRSTSRSSPRCSRTM